MTHGRPHLFRILRRFSPILSVHFTAPAFRIALSLAEWRYQRCAPAKAIQTSGETTMRKTIIRRIAGGRWDALLSLLVTLGLLAVGYPQTMRQPPRNLQTTSPDVRRSS